MRLLRTKRKTLLFIILGVFLVFVCFLGFRLWKTRHSRKAAGIYITSGGQSYLVIERGFLGSLNVKEGYFITSVIDLFNPRNLSGTTLAAEFSDDRLFLTQQESYLIKGASGRITERDRFLLSLELKPSQSIPGDWDLQNAELNGNLDNSALLFSGEYWKEIKTSGSWRQFRENLVKPFRIHQILGYIYDPREKPLYSLIHRVDDERLIHYFRLRLNGVQTRETLDLARELAASHPGDPYLELHRIEMEALAGNPEEAERLYHLWQKTHSSFPDLLLQKMARKVFRTVRMERMKNPQQTFPSPDKIIGTGVNDLSTLLVWLKGFFASDQLFFISYPLVPSLYSTAPTAYPNFRECLDNTRLLQVMAILYLFQGRREESLEILCSLYRIGQSLNAHGSIMQRMIGINIRTIACNGLQIYILNACETAEDFQKSRAMLERLNNIPAQEDGSNILENERSAFVSLLKPLPCIAEPNYFEGFTKHKYTDMKFQLLRMAAAAKYRFITAGDFPSSEQGFAPFLSQGLPADVFAKNAPLHFTRSSPDEFTVYSFGPDEDDDTASVIYDPTNGTITDGDIVMTIPRERKFPFPRNGVYANSAYDLLKQFPNGLPPDMFTPATYLDLYSDTRCFPLSIIESTDTHPVVIFSFGPDINYENENLFPEPFLPALPTRVTPTPSPTLDPAVAVPTPDPGPHPSHERTIQMVFRRSNIAPPPQGFWFLESFYDPTNGISSEGDLFIEIPKKSHNGGEVK